MNYNNNPAHAQPDWVTSWKGSGASFEFEEKEEEMEPGQVELSSLMGWLRTFSLQSQVSHTFGFTIQPYFWIEILCAASTEKRIS